MNRIARLCIVVVTTAVNVLGVVGVATAAPSMVEDVGIAQAPSAACVIVQSAKLLRDVDRKVWQTRAARDSAVRSAIAQAKSRCLPGPYDVRAEAVQGRGPVTGTLRIACRNGFELSPTTPPGAYSISFGALTPESSTSVTRTARTATSYEIDYTIQPQTPSGGGLYLQGTCVPTRT
jgi:hypothetical protein